MFITEKKLEKVLSRIMGIETETEPKINSLKEKIQSLKDELADLKTKKTMEEREIEHLVKMKEEKLLIEYEKKVIALERKTQEKENTLLKNYHDKTLELLNKKSTELQEIYKGIMERLPNVNMEIKKEV